MKHCKNTVAPLILIIINEKKVQFSSGAIFCSSYEEESGLYVYFLLMYFHAADLG